MHSINGYVYGNQPLGLRRGDARKGQRVRWYLMGMGTEVDLHTPHWHGNTVTSMGMRTDVVGLLPASMVTADMTPDDAGDLAVPLPRQRPHPGRDAHPLPGDRLTLPIRPVRRRPWGRRAPAPGRRPRSPRGTRPAGADRPPPRPRGELLLERVGLGDGHPGSSASAAEATPGASRGASCSARSASGTSLGLPGSVTSSSLGWSAGAVHPAVPDTFGQAGSATG